MRRAQAPTIQWLHSIRRGYHQEMGAHEDQKINMYESEEPLGSLDVYVHPNTWLCLNISVFPAMGLRVACFSHTVQTQIEVS